MSAPQPVARPDSRPTRRCEPGWLLAGCTSLFALAYLLWLALAPKQGAFALSSNLAQIVPAVAAAGFAVRNACTRALDPAVRRSWALLGAGLVCYSLGQMLWAWYEAQTGAPQFGTWADVAYLGYYPCVLAGLLAMPNPAHEAGRRLTFVLDTGTVLVGIGMIVWTLTLRPALAGANAEPAATALACAYPVGDLLLLFGISHAALRQPPRSMRRPLQMLLPALACNLAADLGYGVLSLENTYESGDWPDALYMTSLVCSLWSARMQARPDRAAEGTHPAADADVVPRQPMLTGLPYLAIVLGYGLLLAVAFDPRGSGADRRLVELIAGAVLLTALVVARQAVAVRENLHLHAERAVQRNEQRFRSLVQNASEVILILDAGATIGYASPSAERILGYAERELVGRRFDFLPHPDDLEAARADIARAATRSGLRAPTEWRLGHRDGGWLYAEIVLTNLLDDPCVQGLVLTCRDVSERKSLVHQLMHQAFHDPLTGLANRVLFHERAAQALARQVASGQTIAALFLDLDNFKTINDSLGHGAGDRVLVVVAERLRGCLRAGDLAARLGGDEFAVLLESDGVHVEEAQRVGARILDALNRPIALGDGELVIGASAGIAPGDSAEDAEALLRNADVAMYEAKSRGKGRCRLFEPGMHAAALGRLELEAALRQALERDDELLLHYQPIVELAGGRIVGTEALVRWQRPGHGLVPPAQFVGLAEETGLIVALGRRVLAQACRQCRHWQLEYPQAATLGVSVNLSGRQLQAPDLVETVQAALAASGLAAGCLTLELTESTLMHDAVAAGERLAALKALGVRLAIDDFGTGYSSLAYLQHFPIDALKIDRSFVAGLDRDARPGDGAVLVQAILSLGAALGLHTVAEGIEVAGQHAALRALGCTCGQGYWYSRPLPPAEIGRQLAAVTTGGTRALPVAC